MSTQQHHSSDRCLTRQQLADKWGVHVITIKRWEKAGRLQPQRLGPRTIRYPIAYVEDVERNGITD